MIVVIPDDLASDVVHALQSTAEFYRRDTAHDPEDVAALQRDADRLDKLADQIEAKMHGRAARADKSGGGR